MADRAVALIHGVGWGGNYSLVFRNDQRYEVVAALDQRRGQSARHRADQALKICGGNARFTPCGVMKALGRVGNGCCGYDFVCRANRRRECRAAGSFVRAGFGLNGIRHDSLY